MITNYIVLFSSRSSISISINKTPKTMMGL